MSMFTVSSIYEDNTNNILVTNKSFITECFEFNKSIYSEVCLHNRELSLSILESKTTDMVIRVMKTIITIIDKIIKFISEISKRIIREIKNSSDNMIIIKNKKIIEAFNNSFTIQEFNYTINDGILNTSCLDTLRDHVYKANTCNTDNINDVYKVQGGYNTSAYLDKIRGRIITPEDKPSKSIEAMDYSDMLFKCFRDGKLKPIDITVNNDTAMDYYKYIEGYGKTITNISREENNIIDKLAKIKSNVNKISGLDVPEDKFALLINEVLSEVDNITRLYTVAISYKYAAILNNYNVSKNVLMSIIQIGGGSNVTS